MCVCVSLGFMLGWAPCCLVPAGSYGRWWTQAIQVTGFNTIQVTLNEVVCVGVWVVICVCLLYANMRWCYVKKKNNELIYSLEKRGWRELARCIKTLRDKDRNRKHSTEVEKWKQMGQPHFKRCVQFLLDCFTLRFGMCETCSNRLNWTKKPISKSKISSLEWNQWEIIFHLLFA